MALEAQEAHFAWSCYRPISFTLSDQNKHQGMRIYCLLFVLAILLIFVVLPDYKMIGGIRCQICSVFFFVAKLKIAERKFFVDW
jgi:hypothetical protein